MVGFHPMVNGPATVYIVIKCCSRASAGDPDPDLPNGQCLQKENGTMPKPDPRQARSDTVVSPHTPTEGFAFLLIFVLLVAGVVSGGWIYYRNFTRQFRDQAQSQLAAIADLKVGDLAQWRQERLADGAVLFGNAAITDLVRRCLEKPDDADAHRQLQFWFDKYRGHGQYDAVRLLDAQGVTRLSVPANLPTVSAAVAKGAASALQSGQVTLQDLYRSENDRRVHLGVLIPLLDEQDANRPLGVIYLRIDPAVYLYPFIQRWPAPSKTAETLLVRREGHEVVFLNELRFQSNTALTLRLPLDRVMLPAAQAAVGREGIMEGVDYRGTTVIAALRTVPDSPWALVARMDVAELYAPLRRQFWQVIAMVTVMLFGVGAGMVLVWRQQQVRHFREQAEVGETLRVSELRYRRLFEAAHDGVLILDAATGMVVDVNPYLVELLGVPREVFLGKKLWELGFFKDIAANEANFAKLQQNGYIRYEDLALEGSDGKRHEVEFVSNIYWVNRQKVIQCNIRDISERVRMTQALVEQNAELARFLYTASHDLKSPVVTVRTFLGYLEQDMAAGDAGRIAKDIDFIRTASAKMLLLLDDVLEMSRIGRVVAPAVTLTVRQLVDDALGAVAGRIAERGVAVTVTDHERTLHGDRIRLGEIFQNLIENACKFMGDQKEPRIEVGTMRNAECGLRNAECGIRKSELRNPKSSILNPKSEIQNPQSEIVFFVRDNGIGIDPRFQAKVFNLFEKFDPKAEGTGVGLALVKRIVELYAGRIWVESAGLGQGTCFYFTLPTATTGQPTAGETS